ncbi:MAG TPA: serine hydrolase [Steroidobacteraceae bacterium]|jgi:CubicO group peptidase (beta-lactamase class C family)|nr:serine hydrolase [Steroidobacteraceae bacterium]
MKTSALALEMLLCAATAFTATAFAAPPSGFDNRVESLRKQTGVPGIAIAIVENDEVVMAKGFGVKKLGSSGPVDGDTIFMTGSTGKAFTVAALGILVDQGKIRWDDKVIDHLPGFQMYDPWVTREMSIRDLLVHRSGLGLGAGDLLFVPRTNLSRAESVRRLRYIKPATSFRSAYAYDNILYMVAGQLIEDVTGETWEKFTRDHVLRPAGMLHSTTDDEGHFSSPDRVQPHARMNGGLRGVGDQEVLNERDNLGANASPAGGLAISANDMARWLMIQLDGGALPNNGGRLFSEAAHNQMWKPVVLLPTASPSGVMAKTQPMFSTYALGWDVRDYRGTKIIWHGGAVFGSQSAVVLIPDKHVGFSIEINCEDGEMIVGLMYELLDHYLGLPKEGWPEKISAQKHERVQEALKAYQANTAQPAKIGPSLPLERYVGTYADPWYGNIEIGQADGALTIDFKSTPRMGGALQHWQYDSFVTKFDDKTIEPAYVTFGLNADGKVEHVTLKAVSPLADFSYDYQDLLFTPVAAKPK